MEFKETLSGSALREVLQEGWVAIYHDRTGGRLHRFDNLQSAAIVQSSILGDSKAPETGSSLLYDMLQVVRVAPRFGPFSFLRCYELNRAALLFHVRGEHHRRVVSAAAINACQLLELSKSSHSEQHQSSTTGYHGY